MMDVLFYIVIDIVIAFLVMYYIYVINMRDLYKLEMEYYKKKFEQRLEFEEKLAMIRRAE